MDLYFTFIPLAIWALEKRVTFAGTMRHDRISIPKEIKAVTNRDEKSVMHLYHSEKNFMLTSYIAKRSRERRMSSFCRACMIL